MTKKEFEKIRSNQPIEVRYFYPYEGKEPKNYHQLSSCFIKTEIKGDYFIFSGRYHKFINGRFTEHYATYTIHFKNIRWILYNRPKRKY